MSNAVRNSSVCDFVSKVFVASAFGFGRGGGKDGLFFGGDFSANELGGNFVKCVLRWRRAVVILEGTKGKAPAARERFVGCPGAFGFPGGCFGCGEFGGTKCGLGVGHRLRVARCQLRLVVVGG